MGAAPLRDAGTFTGTPGRYRRKSVARARVDGPRRRSAPMSTPTRASPLLLLLLSVLVADGVLIYKGAAGHFNAFRKQVTNAANLQRLTSDSSLAMSLANYLRQCDGVSMYAKGLKSNGVYYFLHVMFTNNSQLDILKSVEDFAKEGQSIFDPKDRVCPNKNAYCKAYYSLVNSRAVAAECGQEWCKHITGRSYNRIFACAIGPRPPSYTDPRYAAYIVGKPCSRCGRGRMCMNKMCVLMSPYKPRKSLSVSGASSTNSGTSSTTSGSSATTSSKSSTTSGKSSVTSGKSSATSGKSSTTSGKSSTTSGKSSTTSGKSSTTSGKSSTTSGKSSTTSGKSSTTSGKSSTTSGKSSTTSGKSSNSSGSGESNSHTPKPPSAQRHRSSSVSSLVAPHSPVELLVLSMLGTIFRWW